jgi:hypothetical protein
MDKQRDTDGHGQAHRWTKKGTQMDRDRETDGQKEGEGERDTQTDRKRDRDTDRQGQGHRRTGTGTQMDSGHRWTRTQTDMDRDMDTDIDNYNGQLTKNYSIESDRFLKILQNSILSANAINRFKSKHSSVKLTFSK